MDQGLGIKFYEVELENKGREDGNLIDLDPEPEDVTATPSPSSRSGRDPATVSGAAQPQSVETLNPNRAELQTPSFNYEPFEIPDDPPHSLIEKLLEENYRGQAESFVRLSSQASVQSLSLTQTSSRSSSVASSIRTNGPFERASVVYTPTRKPSKGDNLSSDHLLQTNHSLRTPSGANRVIVEPYLVKSGSSRRKKNRSGFSPESAPSPHNTYGHRVFTVPRIPNNRPTIPKRSERSFVQIRGPFYFTSQERDAIGDLVLANPRECDRHPDCTDCHNIEYAYFENKAMPTSMPPEERQKIINNNRSLRNIKNVRISYLQYVHP